MNIILTGILVILTAILVFLAVFFRKIRDWEAALLVFTTPQGKDEASPLSNFIEAAAARAGHSIALELKTTLMGKASGEARRGQAIESAALQDIAGQQSPLLGMAMQMFPNLGRKVARNPALLDQLLKMLPRMQGGMPGAGPGPGNNHNEDTPLKLGL